MNLLNKFIVFIISVILCSLLLYLILTKPTTGLTSEELKTLRFVQVIFRHGERSIMDNSLYPSDPYKNYTYPPFGHNTLTKKGRQQMYNVGTELRYRYNQFLGDDYLANLIKSRTTEAIRTQLSLQLVLAALFPPKNQQIWRNNLDWQPIPYEIIPKKHDKVFHSIYCPSFRRAIFELYNRLEIQRNYQNDKELFDYISLHTGANLTRADQLYILYDTLKVQEMFGLSLPKWIDRVYPDELKKWSITHYEYLCYTDQLKRLFVGYALKMFINEIYDKIHGRFVEKFSLYSVHDYNIIGFGIILKLFKPQLVPFGSYFLIELHEIDNNYKLKIYYQDFNQTQPKLMKLFNGQNIIGVDDFYKFCTKFFAEDDECEESENGLDTIYL